MLLGGRWSGIDYLKLEWRESTQTPLAAFVVIAFLDPLQPSKAEIFPSGLVLSVEDVLLDEGEDRLHRGVVTASTDLSRHTPAELRRVAADLNERPRKILDWDTPTERLHALMQLI